MVVFSYLFTKIYPAVFFLNYLLKIAAIWLKRGQKGKFFASDKPENHTTKRKEEEK